MRPAYDEDGKTAGKRHPKAYALKNVPGPGHYEPIDHTGGPRYTIGLRHYPKPIKCLDRTGVPGVGTYELRKDEDFDVPCFKMDRDQRKNLNLNQNALKNPAPNKYIYDYNAQSSKGPRWTFSKTERFGKERPKSAAAGRINVPGPGSYKTQTFMGKEGPHIAFGKDIYNHSDAADEAMFKVTKNYPAPGTYNLGTKYVSDTPIYSMSKLKRKEIGNDKFISMCPGPDKYQPDKFVSSTITKYPKWSVGKANRDEDAKVPGSKKKRIQTPGPGHYRINNGYLPEGPKYSMAKKLANEKPNKNPGPADYNTLGVTLHLPNEPKFSIGKEKKGDNMKQAIKDGYPSSAKYYVKDSQFTGGITIPKDARYKEPKFVVPGPGQYRIPTAFDYINDYTRLKGVFDPTFKYV